jgi:K+-sensing histidine kinase KdpD
MDITKSKHVEVALRQANNKLKLLNSITRHDITNQLSSLKGNLTVLQKKQPDISFSKYFQNIVTAVEQVTAMIQFTKTYEEIGVKAPVWQDCRTLVDTAAKQVLLGKVMVKNDIPADFFVLADPLIVKVCYNLMDNALRYGGKITTIRFSKQLSGDTHLIVCEDNGDGVPSDEKKRIFERGFGRNTGLGLFLAREILSITGITIAETGEPGKGARFEMAVPEGGYRAANGGENPVHY